MKSFTLLAMLGLSLAASAASTDAAPARKGYRDPYDLRNIVKPGTVPPGEHPAVAPARKAAPARAGATATTYTGVFGSFFESYEFKYDGGNFLTYDVDITIDGTTATINNLFNFKNQSDSECVEVPVTGVYDDAARTITVNTPKQYDKATRVGTYYGDMPVVLLTGTVRADQSMTALPKLVFNVSEDGKTISTQQDFAAMIYTAEGSPYGFLSVYMGGVMKQPGAAPEVICFNENVDFGDVYADQTATRSLRAFNFSDTPADVTLSASPTQFGVAPASLTITDMEYSDFKVTFTPSSVGSYTGSATLAAGSGNKTINLTGSAITPPDYSYLVKGGNMTFTTGADYPFQNVEVNGIKVARSNNIAQTGNVSYLTVSFDVPEGQLGTFKWKGAATSTVEYGGVPEVYADDVKVLSYAGKYAYNVNESLKFTPGHHEVKFMMTVMYASYFYEKDDYHYVYDLELTSEPMKEVNAVLATPVVKVANSIHHGNPIERQAFAVIRNEGSAKLAVTEVKGSAHFSGSVPAYPTAATLEEITVPITFKTDAAGEYNETITLVTSAGNFDVVCSTVVRPEPDFQSIVKEGQFTFTTTEEHPFLVKDGVAYNSTAKEIDLEQTFCTLRAEFNVPEGKAGILSWKGRLSSSPIDDITDCLQMTIASNAGYFMLLVPDEFDLDSSKYPYYYPADPTPLTVTPGPGYISFSYYQFGDSKYYGDDIVEIKDLALTLVDAVANDAELQTPELVFPETYEGSSACVKARFRNTGTSALAVTGVDGSGTFVGVVPEYTAAFRQYIEVPIYFFPPSTGLFEEDVVIHTNAGNFTVKCKGYGKSMDGIIMIQDFEGDLDWMTFDRDADNDCWDWAFNAFGGYTMGHTHSGIDCIVSFSRDRNGNFEPDNWAISPAYALPAAETRLGWWVAADYGDPTPLGDIYSVYVAEGEPLASGSFNIDNYECVYTEELQTTEWHNPSVSLAKWAGKKIHFAFRHHDSVGKYMVKIDDVSITDAAGVSDAVADAREVAVKYYTVDGIELKSALPHCMTICVHFYDDGTTVARKVIK